MSKRILLVEDDPDDEALTLRAFQKCGLTTEVVVARDGAQVGNTAQCRDGRVGRVSECRGKIVYRVVRQIRRTGAGPEVVQVTFELSTDGVSYAPLGIGTRSFEGWHLDGLALPFGQNLFIRARGYYATGGYNGSGSVVEAVRNAYLTSFPVAYLPLVMR